MNRIIILLLISFASLALAQEDPAAIAERVQQVYDEQTGLAIDFTQILTSGTSGKSLSESGIVDLKKPGFMRWEYQDPEFKLYIADGSNIYFYVPKDNQVMTMAMDTADQEQTHILFLMGRGDLKRDFQITYEEYEEPLHPDSIMLNLIPNSEQDYDYLVLEINPRDYFVERIMSFDPLGNITEFVFRNFREKSYEDSHFNFVIPKGVEVVAMDEVQ